MINFKSILKQIFYMPKAKMSLWKLCTQVKITKYFYKQDWFYRPDLFFKENINDLGDLYLEYFFDSYAAKRLEKNMYIFEWAYQVMTDRKNYSRNNAFGEMHGDCYMWIEKCDHSKVIVYETQSSRHLFIKNNDYPNEFHIRALFYQYAWPSYKRTELKGITLSRYKRSNFEAGKSYEENRGLYYGDTRDTGYVGSLKHKITDEIEGADQRTLFVIGMMKFWEPYLEKPEDLE